MSMISDWAQRMTKVPEIPQEPLTMESLNRWHRAYLMDAMMGLRYGQSFCNYFAIEDNILYYNRDMDSARKYIINTYIKEHNDEETKP